MLLVKRGKSTGKNSRKAIEKRHFNEKKYLKRNMWDIDADIAFCKLVSLTDQK